MRRRSSLLTGSLALTFALTACGGGGSHAALPAAQTGLSAAASSTFAYGVQALRSATPGAAATLGTMSVAVLVTPQNAQGLTLYAQQVSEPSSGLYRHFLSAADIGARYGARPSDEAAVAAYFQSFGLKVGTWPQHLGLRVAGPQAAMEKAFGTTFISYGTANGTVYGPSSTPRLARPLPISAVADLIVAPQNLTRQYIAPSAPRGQGNNAVLGYTPQQIASAFDFTGAYNAGLTGAGISIGIIGTGPVDPADLTAYKGAFGFGGSGTYTQVAASAQAAANAGGSPTATPPPVTAPCQGALPSCNPEDGEAQIDTEQALLAPDADTRFYLAYVPQECADPSYPQNGACGPNETNYGALEGIAETDDEIQQAIADNGADVLSLSFGGGELGQSAYFLDQNGNYSDSAFGPLEFAALAAEGIATFVSSGDSGAQGCARPQIPNHVDSLCVSYPASDKSVVSVGGVTTPLDAAGRLIGPIVGWGSSTNLAGLYGASTGGVSAYIPAPAWQTGAGIVGTMRNQPDVALDGDAVTGVATIANSSFGFAGSGAYGGTSVAAPEMAAMWALVLQACKASASCATAGGAHPYRLGNPAPLLYGIYNTPAAYPTVFYDVTSGGNGVIGCVQDAGGSQPCPSPMPTADPGYSAGTGYDQVTGIGVPFARHLIKQITKV